MTTIYTSVSVSGYNASPPSDDGSAVSTNKITWSKHKEKLADPVKTAAESINTNLVTAFGRIFHSAVTAVSTTTTISANDRGKTYATTNSITVNLPAAATAGDNFLTTVINTDGGTVTIDGNSSETINGQATLTLGSQYQAALLYCDGTEWYGGTFLPAIADNKIMANVSGGQAFPSASLDFKDEDDMSSDSATALASQQSIKAYVDANGVPSGGVLQTLQTVKTDTFSTASTSFTDVTGLSQAITPSATSSKVLVSFSATVGASAGQNVRFLIVRTSTGIGLGASAGSRVQETTSALVSENGGTQNVHFSFLDSPSTTSATTYKIQMLVTGGTGYINRSATDTNSASFGRGASQIMVQEIKG